MVGSVGRFFADAGEISHPENDVKQTLGATILALGAVLGVQTAARAQAPVCAPVCAPAFASAPPLASFPARERLYSIAPSPLPMRETAPACSAAGLGLSPGPWERRDPTLTAADARRALARARALGAQGRVAEAELALELVDAALPRLNDRIALERGDLLLAQDPVRAQHAYEAASESVDGTVRVRAQVGVVRAAIAASTRDAEQRLNVLLRQYPELSEEGSLRLALAAAEERHDRRRVAARIYQDLDLNDPGSPEAVPARAALARLHEAGVWMRDWTAEQRVARLERLMASGPFPLAREELQRLRQDRGLSPEQRGRVAQAGARLAAVEGRFDDEPDAGGEGRTVAVGADDEEVDDVAGDGEHGAAPGPGLRNEARAREDTAQLRGRLAYRRVPTTRLFRILDLGARAGLADVVDDSLEALARRDLPPRLRYQSAITATGVAREALLIPLFQSLVDHRSLWLSARYYLARSLERSGDLQDAERAYLEVQRLDQSGRGYYAMWAGLRLDSTRRRMLVGPPVCGPTNALAGADGPRPRLASRVGMVDTSSRRVRRPEGSAAPVSQRRHEAVRPAPDYAALANSLENVAQQYGEAFPWFGRAVDLLSLHEADAAGDELYEAYLAYRQATGRPVARAGLASVSRGADRHPPFVPFPVRRARRALDNDARQALADIAAALGETGTEVGFGGSDRLARLPRAYAAQVERAAARHGLDPNLLFAVMRVESVYQARIVSYAGAVGLMQIMPRTGRHIADALNKDDFETADLLDPETNLDFAAWYLASLIERFDGHLPLAIASYNGGPHNVRRWIHEHAINMPLDTFLEEIPFTQTHRYVRRVLTYYEEYRAQQNLAMTDLSVDLPQPGIDRIGF